MDYESALKIGSAFGGGMGLMGETCGAVTGAFMVIGLKHGAANAANKESRTKTYDLVKKFTERFKARNESIVCRDLIDFDPGEKKDLNPDEWLKIIEKCPEYITSAAEILEEILAD
jgi:C_GCAxxG_C_C family probable redox protein